MDLLSATLLLIIVTDPLGNIPMVISCLEGTRNKRLFIIREIFFAFVVLVVFLFFGPGLLGILDLSEEAVRLAGGIILFIIAIKMIFPTDTSWLGVKEGEEPMLFPLAVPLVAGPSAVATVIFFAAQHSDMMGILFLAILIAMAVSLITFWFASVLHRFMGHRGLAAMQRLMGMLLTAIAVQMLINGLNEVFSAPL